MSRYKVIASILVLILSTFSCAQKYYEKDDYTFYDTKFKLDSNSLLRTDGVYVIEKIETDENGGRQQFLKKQPFIGFTPTDRLISYWILVQNLGTIETMQTLLTGLLLQTPRIKEQHFLKAITG